MANLVGAHVFLWYLSVPDEIPLWINGVINVVAISAIMGWGMFIGSRRELLWTLRDRAERAEAERDLRSDKTRGDGRARIARERPDEKGGAAGRGRVGQEVWKSGGAG